MEAVEESKETIGGTGGAEVRLLMYLKRDGPWLYLVHNVILLRKFDLLVGIEEIEV